MVALAGLGCLDSHQNPRLRGWLRTSLLLAVVLPGTLGARDLSWIFWLS